MPVIKMLLAYNTQNLEIIWWRFDGILTSASSMPPPQKISGWSSFKIKIGRFRISIITTFRIRLPQTGDHIRMHFKQRFARAAHRCLWAHTPHANIISWFSSDAQMLESFQLFDDISFRALWIRRDYWKRLSLTPMEAWFLQVLIYIDACRCLSV